MIRKMRIGQIHGAAISNEGMTEINPYFTTFYMPMMYQSYDEVDFVRERLSDELLNKTEENGFKILTMVDVGWAYWFSTEPIYTPDDLKNNKIFIWAGDYKSAQLYEKHGYQAVPLAMTDVLSGLQTGLITALGFNPLYALAQQLFSIADNMLDMKWGNLTAAIIIDLKTWKKIKPEHQKSMLSVAKKIGDGFQQKNRYESDKSVEVMKKYGLKVNTPTPEQVKIWHELVNSLSPDIRGSLIEENAFDRLVEIKKEMQSR
jgi:TRAP-type C4-dicarboxylate transport system substrate-binding protein